MHAPLYLKRKYNSQDGFFVVRGRCECVRSRYLTRRQNSFKIQLLEKSLIALSIYLCNDL
jgi:hypothetical protein